MLIQYLENSIFGVTVSWSGRISILLVIGGLGWVRENGPVDISACRKVERNSQFKRDDSHRPDVTLLTVQLVLGDLWRCT